MFCTISLQKEKSEYSSIPSTTLSLRENEETENEAHITQGTRKYFKYKVKRNK